MKVKQMTAMVHPDTPTWEILSQKGFLLVSPSFNWSHQEVNISGEKNCLHSSIHLFQCFFLIFTSNIYLEK